MLATKDTRYCKESKVAPLFPIRTPISSPLKSISIVAFSSLYLMSITTVKFIASKTLFKNSFTVSSTEDFTLALIIAGFALKPKNPVEPSVTTSYSNLSLVTTNF